MDPAVVVTRERGRWGERAWPVGLPVAAGLVTGILTVVGQGNLDGGLNRLANSGAIWVTVAFAVGSVMRSNRAAALAGLVTLALAVGGYYAAAAVAGAGVSTGSLLIWGGTAIVGGPVFGIGGRTWRASTGRMRALAAALLGGVFIAEGAYTLLIIPEMAPAGWVEVGIGVAVVILLPRTGRERLLGLAALVPLTLIGLVGYALIDRLFMMR